MAEQKLKQKAASGMVWTALQKYSTMFIQFVSGIILARLLTPYDYGCIGMLSIFMVLADAFIDGGFGSALIQKKQATQVDYSTIFYWNLGVAFLMYATLYACAPAISRFYGIPILCNVLRVQGLVLFIHAFNIVQRNRLKKKMNFKLLSIVTITTSLIALSITIFMAYKGYGVWALVAQNLIIAFIPAVVFWFYVKWRPIWAFSWKSFKELFSFGVYVFLTNILNKISLNIQGLLIGKVYTPRTMGYYSKAHSTESMASSSISSIIDQVSYPLYAEVQNNLLQLANIIRRMTMTIAYLTFPLMFILILLAQPIFLLLYSERWMPCVPYFQVLCFVGMGACLSAVNTQAIAAIGKSKLMFMWTLVKRTIGLTAIVGGLFMFGMKGLLFGVVFNSWFSYFVNIALISKHIGYKFWRQFLDLLPIVVVSVMAAGISYGIGYYLHLNIYLEGVLKFLVFLTIYLGWSFIFKPESYSFFMVNVFDRFKPFKKMKKG